MPIPLYDLEAFLLYNYLLKSLHFVINRFVMKLFRSSNMHAVLDWMLLFVISFLKPGFQHPTQRSQRTHYATYHIT